jgi:anti-sigma-K factor RskA
MDHGAIKNLLPLAAVVSLEPEEARALEDHLRTGCDECEPELRELREAAASMAYALDPAGSQQRVWERLDARLRASERGAAVRPASRRGAAAARPALGRVGVWRAAAGGLTAAAIGLAVYAGIVSDRLNHSQADNQRRVAELDSRLTNARAELMNTRGEVRTLQAVLADQSRLQRVLMEPDLRLTRLEPLTPAPGAKAIVAVSGRNNAAVIQASGLPAAPDGKIYELWWITKESGPVEAGLFQASPGRTTIAPASPPPPGQHVMLSAVTLEPLGGVSKPTGAMYLKGLAG